jgi:hypothetical protein
VVRTLVNVVTVNVGWLVCVMGAAAGYQWLGPLAVLAFFALHLLLVKPRRPELILAVVLIVSGFAVDTLLGLAGAVDPVRGWDWAFPLSPPWMVALWVNFGTTLSTSLRWLEGRPLLSALLGAAGGPSAYAGGAGLGAASIGEPSSLSLVMVGAAWAAALPLAVDLAARLRAASRQKRRSLDEPPGAATEPGN